MKQKAISLLSTLLKGLCIGGTMLVPGVSGGSMAIILGIYDRLISAVSSFFKNIKANIVFLVVFVLGSLTGMILFANPILKLLEMFYMPMIYFFIGAVAGSAPMIYRQSGSRKISWKTFIYPIVGFIIVFAVSMIPVNNIYNTENVNITTYILLVTVGIAAAIALVLPGISVSYMFLLFGMYETVIKSIKELDFKFLLPLAAGLIIGIILTTKILESAMKKFPEASYMIILGFILGSVAQIFPGLPSGVDIIICIITFIIGFTAIYLLSGLENKNDNI